jgi:hypothetical protein
MSYHGMPIMGEFYTTSDPLVFKGGSIPPAASDQPQPQTEPIATVGILLSNLKMVNGRLRAAVRFDEVTRHSVCELVAGYNLGTKGQVTVGLGGSGAMSSIREWLPPVTSEQMVGSWANYALLGDRANLKAGITYEIGVRVLGSSITLDVDGVQVATTTLPAAVNQGTADRHFLCEFERHLHFTILCGHRATEGFYRDAVFVALQ